jgi:hypothetical protein
VAPRIVMYNVHYIQYLLSSSLQNYSNFGFIFFSSKILKIELIDDRRLES